jgi:DNA repair exonuclease SbcCD ATPase subunit
MIPKRIWLKNFLSFGEQPAEFTFADDDPLWVLCGPNGVGKSAVFDAITYAFYGRHRGGKVDAAQLVRHGANGFEIEFDFEFNGIDFRIRRTRVRKKGGRTTQHLLKRIGEEWKCVRGNDPAGAVTADDIEKWVTETLGLGYESFTNSVLLRQGEADKLFSSSRDERIAVLKGIIGFEQFEALSRRVHAATTGYASKAEGFWAQRNALQPVTDEQLALAEKAVEEAETTRTTAESALGVAIERVGQAKEWEKLEKQRTELVRQLAEAKARAAEGRQIRSDKATLDDLTGAVPVLEALFKVRSRMAGLREKLDDARRTLRGKELAREIVKEERRLIDVAEVERLDEKLQEYPNDLDTQVEDSIQAEKKGEAEASKASEAKIKAETLRDQALERQQAFAEVAVGMPCSRCGQPVNEAHAADERTRLASEIKAWQAEFETTAATAKDATDRLTKLQKLRKKLEDAKRERGRLTDQRDTKRENLSALGELTTAANLRARLADLRMQLAEAEGRPVEEESVPIDAKRLDTERRKLDGEVTTARNTADALQRDLDKAHGEEQTTLNGLSDQWNRRLPSLDARQVMELAAAKNRLIDERVAEKFKALEQDDVKRAGWEERLAAFGTEIADIPVEGRIAVAEAEKRQNAAKASVNQAAVDRDAAIKNRNVLDQRKKEYDRLTVAHRDATEQHRLHKKLDDLLGQVGLQRELVRDAEEQIVAFANETLQHLSDGDLSLEEDTALESTKAFDLSVRRVGGEPIGVAFLSGSQRFRVAVSVALAVGRFASGRARPLEGVIIDEGFGSLDRDGLRAMADELKRLQRESALRRVILVSHQPDFTDHFSVGYALAADEDGTAVTPFRR